MLLEARLENIYQSAGLDPEKLPPPKDILALNQKEELEAWYDSRDKLRQQLASQPKVLDT